MRIGFLPCLALSLVTAPIAGQERATEFGLGITALGVNITNGETFFVFQASQQFVAAGLYVSPSIAIEPSASISVISGTGSSFTSLGFGVSVPIYARAGWGRSGLFFAPGVTASILSADAAGTSESASQFAASFGVGTKIPLADVVSLRLSGNFLYWFENDTFFDAVTLSAQLGISVFL